MQGDLLNFGGRQSPSVFLTFYLDLYVKPSNIGLIQQLRLQQRMQKFAVSRSVIRLGDFCKFLSTNFLTKVAQNFGYFLAILKSIFCSKNYYFIIWTAIRCIWATFYCNIRGQSYKASTIVIYDSRVVPDLKIPHITTLES